MKKDHCIIHVRKVLFLTLGLIVFVSKFSSLFGQPAIGGRIRNFQTFANDRQGKRTVLRGKDAHNVSRDIAEIIGPRLESLNESNQVTLVIEAPQCLYNNQTHIATSSDAISVQTSEGKFSIKGRGWTWLADESHLIISNEVTAVISKQVLETAGATNQPVSASTKTNQAPGDVQIQSSGFEYQSDGIIFREGVIVKEDQGTMTCRILHAALSQPGNQIERIEADDQVRIEQKDTVATGGRAVYLMRDKLITMTNSPAWKIAEREGTSDLLVLNRSNNHLHTAGHVYMRLPDSSVITNGPDSGSATNRTTNIVEVTANTFDYDQKFAIYRENVHAKETQGTIDCEVLTISFAAEGNRPEKIVAEENVTIVRGSSRVHGNKAVYEIAEDKLRVDGEPKWQIGDKKGESGYLALRPKSQEFQAGGGVHMIVNTLPGLSLKTMPGSKTNGTPVVQTNEAMEVFAGRLDHKDDLSIFEDAVRIKDSQGEILCEFLVIASGPSNQVTRIVADQNVRIIQTNMVTTSERAFYTVTNGIVELTGSPKLKMPDRLLTADVFLLNRSNSTFKTRGKYRIEMVRPPDSWRTNSTRAKT